MELLLERTGTVPPLEKEKIKERLNMFDQLWEESPMIQRMREHYQEKGLQEGRLEGLQLSLVNVVRAIYPDLADFAQQQVAHFNKPETLELLIRKVVMASNIDTARWLLESGPEL